MIFNLEDALTGATFITQTSLSFKPAANPPRLEFMSMIFLSGLTYSVYKIFHWTDAYFFQARRSSYKSSWPSNSPAHSPQKIIHGIPYFSVFRIMGICFWRRIHKVTSWSEQSIQF
ncbi:hypothetical protein Leryth_000376 [Lithospermum erythrorhizon]|nr:hypothetical protein Leryth_000376 [Lithospermum erythrorhizon]